MFIHLIDAHYSFRALLIGVCASVTILCMYLFMIWREKKKAEKQKYSKSLVQRLQKFKKF